MPGTTGRNGPTDGGAGPDGGGPEGGELHLAVALDGAGWHPAAWREDDARPAGLFSAAYWADLAAEAEAGALDFLTIEDSLGIQSADRFAGPDDRTGQVRGRLDAVLVAARIAPLTRSIGLIPAASTTHTEPFHLSTAIATLDYVSEGRAGWQPRISPGQAEAAHFGRREFPRFTAAGRADPAVAAHLRDLFDEAADAVEVVRLLWDSWEDDAVIRDVPTGRFVDRDKLHYIDFAGRWFSVRGPSITPRPPQGQPVVAALAHAMPPSGGERGASGDGGPEAPHAGRPSPRELALLPYAFAARACDVVFVTPRDAPHAADIVAQVREAEIHTERTRQPLAVYADLTVFIDREPGAAAARKRRLDDLDGAELGTETAVFAGPPGELADLLAGWRQTAGLAGFRLRPGALPHDLAQITRSLVPELRRRGAFRAAYPRGTLRERLGLPRAASVYEGSVR